MMSLPCITDHLDHIKGKVVLVRVDFNVPVGDDGVVDVTESFRIDTVVPTLQQLSRAGARVVVLSHLGDGSASLRSIADYVGMQCTVGFIPEYDFEQIEDIINEMAHGSIVMLENIRRHPGERDNDMGFAQQLANYADLYVNEAFSVSHRNHASIVRLPALLPSYIGPRFALEIEQLSMALDDIHPFVLALGGVKFSTKLPLVTQFLKKADTIFIGGALAHPIWRMRGQQIGQSVVDDTDVSVLRDADVMLPADVRTPAGVTFLDAVTPDDVIVDAGIKTMRELTPIIKESELVIWNGPLGNYEQGYTQGTKDFAEMLIRHGNHVIVGGGDTVTVLATLGLVDQFGFVSTGGGAMIEFLTHGTLLGIEAILAQSK